MAAKLGIELTCESQMRPLAKVADEDLPEVLKRASRLVPKGADGTRRMTAEVLTRAVREETMSPDDLKREAEKKRGAWGVRREPDHGSRPTAHDQEAPSAAPVQPAVGSAPAETPLEAPVLPVGVNLQLQHCLDDIRWYMGCVVNTFANGGLPILGRISGLLKFLSKDIMGIRACRVCGCSETDPCDTEHGEGCSWVSDDSLFGMRERDS